MGSEMCIRDRHGDWAPICTNCDAFDTISWKRPERVEREDGAAPLLGFTAGFLASAGKDPVAVDDSLDSNATVTDEPEAKVNSI